MAFIKRKGVSVMMIFLAIHIVLVFLLGILISIKTYEGTLTLFDVLAFSFNIFILIYYLDK